jgi:hypothetical protein
LELPGTKIGEGLGELQHWVEQQLQKLQPHSPAPEPARPTSPAPPPRIVPGSVAAKLHLRRLGR